MVDHDPIDLMIVDFLTGKRDAETISALESWIRVCRENRDRFIDLCERWISAVDADSAARYDAQKAFEDFMLRSGAGKKSPKRNRILPWAAVAVITAGLLSFGAFRGGERAARSHFADITIEAPPGGKTRTVLPDGTTTWLNSGSRITYSQGFGERDRTVLLSGEGYFEVTENKELPFRVISDNLVVRVLGTKFNFRDFPGDPEAVVDLVEGSVELNIPESPDRTVIMKPRDKAYLNKINQELHLERARTRDASAWTRDILLFDEEPLSTIAAVLERTYDVSIVFEDEKLADYRFYGCFHIREMSIYDVLEALQSTRKLRYRTKGRTILLY